MSESLAFGRKGGRAVSWNEGSVNGCNNYKFTHGTNMNDCMADAYKQVLSNAYCKTTIQQIEK